MYRDRISEDIYVFTSSVYAQVTAGAILTKEGAIIIDTMPFPSETAQVAEFIARFSSNGAQYLVLTHYHADHVYGSYQFPQPEVVGHLRCRQLLVERGQPGLEATKAHTPELSEVELRLPSVVFEDGDMTLRLGNKTLQLLYTPGHSDDLITAYVKEDKILFASDAVMPVPHVVDGDPDVLIESLRRIKTMNLEMIVQGHGETILRGEIAESLNSNIKYLETIKTKVAKHIEAGKNRESLSAISIESCGKSRIALNGLVQRLHAENLLSLYDRARAAV